MIRFGLCPANPTDHSICSRDLHQTIDLLAGQLYTHRRHPPHRPSFHPSKRPSFPFEPPWKALIGFSERRTWWAVVDLLLRFWCLQCTDSFLICPTLSTRCRATAKIEERCTLNTQGAIDGCRHSARLPKLYPRKYETLSAQQAREAKCGRHHIVAATTILRLNCFVGSTIFGTVPLVQDKGKLIDCTVCVVSHWAVQDRERELLK